MNSNRSKRTIKRTSKRRTIYKRICRKHKKITCKCFKNGKKIKCSEYNWPNMQHPIWEPKFKWPFLKWNITKHRSKWQRDI